jgi:hypothetical protein
MTEAVDNSHPHDRPQTGLEKLRAEYGVVVPLWETAAPRTVSGKISAVFLQDAEPPRVVMLHQLANGRCSIWEKMS